MFFISIDKPLFIGYITEFLTDDDYTTIQQHCATFAPQDENNPMAQCRKNYCIPFDDLYNKTMHDTKYINMASLIKCNVFPAYDPPMEYRVYPKGAGMAWHSDVVLFEKPQLECLFTIHNTSDSVTQYKDRYGVVHSISTKPNSLLVLFAGDVEHHVTDVKNSERSILKYLYTCT